MKLNLISLFKQIKNRFCQEVKDPVSVTVEDPIVISETSNNIMFDTDLIMKSRMNEALLLWKLDGKGWNYLVTDEAFFAAQCWVYTHKIYDKGSENYHPEMMEYIQKARLAEGGDAGWDTLLSRRVICRRCNTQWKMENILYCVNCMTYVCLDCRKNHVGICGEHLVG